MRGRAGCPQCFSAFRKEIQGFLGSRFGSFTYPGEPYFRDPESRDIARRVEELHEALMLAVQEEDYERAASLRDEIEGLRKRLVR
ncbi:MAG: UvrB/UvrC motif-containing protein [candidate division WOR-3 bacterium]